MSAATHTFGPPTSHSITASSVRLSYNIGSLDWSHPSSEESYTVHYSVHLPEKVDPALPVLLLCHPFNNSRNYWAPQIASPILAPYPKVAFDSVGFAQSATNGKPWSFDLAAASVLAALEKEESLRGLKAVLIGDSMGGGPTGLRVGMSGNERVVGVVACGTTGGEEDKDIAKGYDQDAADFAAKCASASAEEIESHIREFAQGMANAGYTDSTAEPFACCRSYGASVIAGSLKQCLSIRNDDGSLTLDGTHAGETMKTNYRCLNYRLGLLDKLSQRPSPLGGTQVLVVHGGQDAAYPAERRYAEATLEAIGEENGELLKIEDAPHFVTVTHGEYLAEKIVDWIGRKCKH